MSLRERTRPRLGIIKQCLRVLLLITASLSAESLSAVAQNTNTAPAQHQSAIEAAEQIAEAQRLLKGPAGNPECVWLGDEWSICSGAPIWTPHSAIWIYTLGLVAQATTSRKHSAVLVLNSQGADLSSKTKRHEALSIFPCRTRMRQR